MATALALEKHISLEIYVLDIVTGSDQKSMSEVKCLVDNMLKAEDFDLHDFEHFDLDVQMKHFDNSEDSTDMGALQQDEWKQANVDIMVLSKEKNPEGNGHPFSVSGLFYWPLIAVIQAAFSEPSSKWFHLTPFKWIWKSSVTRQEQQLYDELYTLDAWIQAYDKLHK
ncbi:hypothetical protein EV702DRAFT_1202455 [Suillus placidus]|uniref:Uncharacterized protein n=1 Tax=Suillus placidus TaxID=48579 RepID=A0A9P6ZLA0_9AGAM|nr:hypothetical protein EV702DRAFT_1202455 [Suillus placidus]